MSVKGQDLQPLWEKLAEWSDDVHLTLGQSAQLSEIIEDTLLENPVNYEKLIGKTVHVSWSAEGEKMERILLAYLPDALAPYVCAKSTRKGYIYSGFHYCWEIEGD